MNLSFEDRGARFRESVEYIEAMAQDYPTLANGYGDLAGDIDLLPKPAGGRLPLLITGSSQQCLTGSPAMAMAGCSIRGMSPRRLR